MAMQHQRVAHSPAPGVAAALTAATQKDEAPGLAGHGGFRDQELATSFDYVLRKTRREAHESLRARLGLAGIELHEIAGGGWLVVLCTAARRTGSARAQAVMLGQGAAK